MSIMDWDGHMTSGEFEGAPMAYFLLGNARITCAADHAWRVALENAGAVRVDLDTYNAADALGKDGEQ